MLWVILTLIVAEYNRFIKNDGNVMESEKSEKWGNMIFSFIMLWTVFFREKGTREKDIKSRESERLFLK